MSVIEIENLNKMFKQNVVFQNLSFKCDSNKIIGIVGENGAGKSVLFKLIAGFIKPNSGKIIIDGVDLNKNNVFPPSLGVLIEEPSFLPDITGYENLKLLASIKNKITDDQILKTLDRVNLTKDKDKKVKHYSLGMKKKLGIAQAIMESQQLILLDEPMNALDEESVKSMRSLFKLIADDGATILIASHNSEDIIQLCQKVYKIENNQLVDRTAEIISI